MAKKSLLQNVLYFSGTKCYKTYSSGKYCLSVYKDDLIRDLSEILYFITERHSIFPDSDGLIKNSQIQELAEQIKDYIELDNLIVWPKIEFIEEEK